MFALADCNNFYASCQRLFRPDLAGKPIVVLSNNDGCIIARSNEAKTLGVPMGAPYYQWKPFFKAHQIQVFSSNYALYGDLSARVMRILESFESNIDVYSIDEAFLNISGVRNENLHNFARLMRQTTLQWTGIPLSIGVAPTRTLAKLAAHAIKKYTKKEGVLVFKTALEALPYLEQTAVGNIWGVGRNWAKKLEYNGIHNAADLALADHGWIRKHYSVVLQRTAMELAGTSCIELDDMSIRQQILVSRSFRPKVEDYTQLHSFISGYISRAAERLRTQKSLTKHLSLFIHTPPQQFDDQSKSKDNSYSNSISIKLSQYTADTSTLIRAGSWGLKKIFKPGYQYYKAGIILNDLIPEKNQQYSLFSAANYDQKAHQRMQLLDSINKRFGPASLRFASTPAERWQMYQKHLSPAYTTRWDELLQVR